MMRRLVLIGFLAISQIVSATKYYVKNGGNDSSNGKSDATAWKTLAKVSSFTFAAGDSILFNRGEVWRETLKLTSSGTSSNYITYASYGSGNKPMILGSSRAVDWTNVSGNIWTSATTVTDPYAVSGYESQIFFELPDGSVKWGHVKKSGTANLVAEYDWTWVSGKVYIYSATDPDIRYTAVEVPQRQNGIDLNDKQYITIDGLELHYQQNRGTYSDLDTKLSGLAIKNCKISYIGKKGGASHGISASYSDMLIQNNEIFEIGRRSVSIYAYGSGFMIQNIIVENNILYNGYHTTGVDISTGTTCSFNNIIIRDNLIYDDVTKTCVAPEDYTSECIFLQNYGSGGTFNNIYVYNNLIMNTTLDGIHLENIQSSFIYNNTFYGVNPNRTNNTILVKYSSTCKNSILENNIFYSNGNNNVNSTAICVYLSGTTDYKEIHANYNIYYQADNRIPIVSSGSGGSYKMSDWAALKSALGWEANSPAPADPKFFSTTNFHLQTGSPARGKGIIIPEVTRDFENTPVNNPPDLGCYTAHTNVVTPLFISSCVEDETPAEIDILFDLGLADITPSKYTFCIKVNAEERSSNFINIAGPVVKLALESEILPGDVVTVSYVKPVMNPLQSVSGGAVENITAKPVTNNVEDITTQVRDEILKPKISLFPNPTHDYFNISVNGSSSRTYVVRIISQTGATVFEDLIDSSGGIVNYPVNFASGLYFVQFLSDGKKLGTQKLIVQ